MKSWKPGTSPQLSTSFAAKVRGAATLPGDLRTLPRVTDSAQSGSLDPPTEAGPAAQQSPHRAPSLPALPGFELPQNPALLFLVPTTEGRLCALWSQILMAGFVYIPTIRGPGEPPPS